DSEGCSGPRGFARPAGEGWRAVTPFWLFSSSSSGGIGPQKTATIASPVYCSMIPPWELTCFAIGSIHSLSQSMSFSGDNLSDTEVNPARSVNNTVATSCCGRGRWPSRNCSRSRQIPSATCFETCRENNCIKVARSTVSLCDRYAVMATAESDQLRAGGTSGSHQPWRKTIKSKQAIASKPLPTANENFHGERTTKPVKTPIALHSTIHTLACHSTIVFIGAALPRPNLMS